MDIIEPCGFALTDRAVRRAAMDYADAAEVVRHAGWAAFLASPERAEGRLVVLTTKAAHSLWAAPLAATDVYLFGRESAGVPEDVAAAADVGVRIPIAAAARSLNIVVAAGVVLAEAHRRLS